jgi:hypothetical protein
MKNTFNANKNKVKKVEIKNHFKINHNVYTYTKVINSVAGVPSDYPLKLCMCPPALETGCDFFLQKKIDEMECKVAASMGSKCVSVCCPSPRLQSRAIGLIVHGAALAEIPTEMEENWQR